MPSLPLQLGPYRLEKVLGRGGMGVVYEAYDQRLERRVAVKRILGAPAGEGPKGPRRRERLRREARNTAQLAHPAVVQVFDLIEDEDSDWIVMELVEGMSLAQLLKDGPLGVDAVLTYGRQIAEGLAAAHGHGIVHRDLKAENVMVMPQGRVKILDFGIAKQFDDTAGGGVDLTLSRSGEVVGTSRAMAPEQARGLKVGPRSDLFSFGVLLYECLAGVSPFRGDSAADTLARVITHHPTPLNELDGDIPAALSELIEKLLCKTKELRPSGALEVMSRLDALIDQRRSEDRGSSMMGLGGRVFEWPSGLGRADSGEAVHVPGVATGLDGSADVTLEDERTLETAAALGRAPDRGRGGPGRWGAGTEYAAGSETVSAPTTFSDSSFRVWGQDRPISRVVLWTGLVFGLAILVLIMVGRDPSSAQRPDPAVSDLGSPVPGAPGESPEGVHIGDDPLRLYEEGMAALRRIDRPENVERAIKLFRGLIQSHGESAAALAGLARAHWEKARNASGGGDAVYVEQGLAMAREAVRLDAYLADGRVSLGLIHYSRGDYDEAEDELSRALELEPNHADALYGLGKLAETQRRHEEAANYYRRAAELRAEPIYFNALGSLQYDLGLYDEAAEAFSRSLELAPDHVHALRNLGGIYYTQGRLDEAASQFQAALKIRPNASLYSNLGAIFFSRGLYSKAAQAFEDALRMDGASNRYIFWLNLGDAYRQIPGKEADAKRSYQVAIQILDATIEAAPGDTRLVSRRAVAHARSGDSERALSDIERVRLAGTGGDVYSLFRLAMAEELCGERESALTHLEEAFRAGLSRSTVRHEPDLRSLHQDPRYHHMLVSLEGD